MKTCSLSPSHDEQWLLQTLQEIGTSLGGHGVRIAGGWVRDHLRGIVTSDMDVLLLNMDAEAFAERLQQRGYGSRHIIEPKPAQARMARTVRVCLSLPSGERFEVDLGTLATGDGESLDEALRQDAAGRDLTINALFYDPATATVEDRTGQGLDDLRRGLLRVPGARRCNLWDDPLRLLRIARFHATTGFAVEAQTRCLMDDRQLQQRLVRCTSPERIGQELLAMWSHPRGSRAMELLHDCGVLDALLLASQGEGELVEQLASWDMDQGNGHHALNLWQHSIAAMACMGGQQADADRQTLALLQAAALLHDVGKRYRPLWGEKEGVGRTYHAHEHTSAHMVQSLCIWLCLGRRFCESLCALVRAHMLPSGLKDAKDPALRRFLRRMAEEGVQWRSVFALSHCDILAKGQADEQLAPVLSQLASLEQRLEGLEAQAASLGTPIGRPVLNGRQIMEVFGNSTAGPWVGEVLQALLEMQDTEPAMDSAEAARRLRALFPAYGAPER
ncbi:Polynucleotide adenylyltransferase region [Desulfurispirillum indicum S5]|uniref:Polynucleotide adenylyltransferase region n=1 Tax=Desulfurispirillum indicum (strain ATCC BAA-1389 / DSM 22839 / S5) TaxID=653733 RepID=E6W6K3_DESIS|nr:HD domain-containing protein [Desulfurispirillum indicum]ADU65003.1 Polynucleotide adenylyltransferase region [Desulfurispirillum indicum S5]